MLAESELRPSLASLVVLATHRFELVQAVQPLAGPLLLQLHHQERWMAVRGLRLLMKLTVEQPLSRSWAGTRQLPVQVPVEPELLTSLAVPLLDRFGPVQAVQ